MPPKKKTAAAAVPKLPPLDGCIIALSGTFPAYPQSALERDFIMELGGSLSKTVNSSTTHLITTDIDYAKPSAKVKQAQSHDGIHIVRLSWLQDCLEKSTRLNEADYTFGAATPPAPATNVYANQSRKRVASPDADGDASQAPAQPKKKSKAAATNGSSVQAQDASKDTAKVAVDGSKSAAKVAKVKPDDANGQTNIATSGAVNIPIDEVCPLAGYRVYIDQDGVIYDANLNQTNASANNNKFYRIQLLHSGGDYKTWTRWGRVGERGQSAMLGNGSLDDALHQFDSKFKGKSGLAWASRGDRAKSGKYTFIERSYNDDSDEEEEAATTKVKTEGVKHEAPESKLDPAVQNLLQLIFNPQYFQATMTQLNYDVNKLPLGKLSKNTIIRGFQALKDLSALLDDASLAQSEYGTSFQDAAEQLSNAFYSLIPHAFGRNRPPVISNQAMLKQEVDLLDSLSDMKDAANIMKTESKSAEEINALDQQFKGLNLDEMTPLKKDGTEFQELARYLVETKGQTHNANYQITNIFRIERQGERDRFDKSPYSGPPRDRRLLWHGSRATNFGGILSQGLRIAPPEAPVSGYMFGKGIYLADMSSKSANYCCSSISNGNALLLLCEAELGDPMHKLTGSSYTAGEDAKAKGMFSTWGQGTTGPSVWKDAECVHPSLKGVKLPDTAAAKPGRTNVNNAYLQYNEYIAYDVAQVRLRYLFQVRM